MLTIIGGIDEFERSLIRKRCEEGIARAKRKGTKFGRPTRLDEGEKRKIAERSRARQWQSWQRNTRLEKRRSGGHSALSRQGQAREEMKQYGPWRAPYPAGKLPEGGRFDRARLTVQTRNPARWRRGRGFSQEGGVRDNRTKVMVRPRADIANQANSKTRDRL